MKKRLRLCRWSAFILVLCLQTQSLAQDAAPITAEQARRIDAIFATWDNTRSPGCALGASLKGSVIYSRGYGMSNLEYDVPITPQSIFSVGSVSKEFTAFSIALLASDGKLSLDDDVRRYVPEVPDYGPKITIRHLLTHTSGLRDAWDLRNLSGRRPGSVILENDLLRMIARQKSPDFAPGAEFFYNNAGYVLLAVIVKRVSGQSLPEFAKARIFRPLDMRDSQILDDHTVVVPRRTSAYRPRAGGGWRISLARVDSVGPDGVVTTVGDLLKWEENFVDARVGGRRLLDEMQAEGRLNNGLTTEYGFGLEVGTHRGLRTFGHGGTASGYVASVVRFPDQHLAIAALCNLRSIDPGDIKLEVADILLGLDVPAPAKAIAPAGSVGDADIRAFAGMYWNTNGVLRFDILDGQLAMDGDTLVPLGGDRFRVGDWPHPVLFTSKKTGVPQQLHILAPVRTFVLSRVTVPSYSETELKSYAGEYRSDELDEIFTIVAQPDGHLALLRHESDPAQLTALNRDMFLTDVSDGAGTLIFLRGRSGNVTGFNIVGRTPRQLSFIRVDVAR